MELLCAHSSLAPTIHSLPAPADLASARGFSLAQIPPAHHKKFPLIHFPQYVSLSSAYPFSACSNRQPFVSQFTKGYAYLFPVSTPINCNSSARLNRSLLYLQLFKQETHIDLVSVL